MLPVVPLLTLLVAFATSETVDEGHVLDTREQMCTDAVNSLVSKYNAIESNSAEGECTDISSYTFPDVCRKPDGDEYEAYYLKADPENPDREPERVAYNDDREAGAKNAIEDLKQSEKFGVPTASVLGYKIQPQTEQNDNTNTEICAASGAGDTFKEHASGESKWGKLAESTSWQYFGGQYTGLFAQYPATVKTTCWCDSYDPRYRPWYSAAVTGPKDMILVLDVSGSMKEEGRMDIMKNGAIAQLDTMTFLDYIQVVSYSSDAKAQGTRLLQGTDENKQLLREYIEQLSPGGRTNGQKGLTLAFEIFKNSATDSKTSGCLRIISFLTDGIMSDIDTGDLSWLVTEQNNMVNANLGKAHIFTYALGSGAKTEDMRVIACENQGWMATIKDGDVAGIKHAMIRYFEYFAGKIPSNTNTTRPRWSDFYMDSSGQGKMTTVSQPVFTTKNGRRMFQGVVGIDVLASDFGKNLDDNAMAGMLNTRSKQCMSFDFTLADLSDSLSSTTEGGVKCEIMENEPSGDMVPTGATHDELEDGACEGSLPWWAILIIVFVNLLFCVIVVFACIRCRKKNGGRTVKQVQMIHQVQHGAQAPHQPQYNVQARQMQVIQRHGMPGQHVMANGGVTQMQQPGSITMGMPPGQYAMPMQQIAPQPMGVVHAQPMGIVQAQPMGIAQGMAMQQPGRFVQPIAVQQNTAANQQSQQFGQPQP